MPFLRGAARRGRARDGIPVVTLAPPTIEIQAVRVCGNPHSHFLYENSDTHVLRTFDGELVARKDQLQGWSRGPKIEESEWVAKRSKRHPLPVCVTRTHPVAMMVKLASNTTKPLKGRLKVAPSLNKGNKEWLKPSEVHFEYPANGNGHWVALETDGQMPDCVGRYSLRLDWEIQPLESERSRFRFIAPKNLRLTMYCIAGDPYDPAYDSERLDDSGKVLAKSDGTLTGTRKRLDHLMKLLDGEKFRHPLNKLEDLIWKLHRGINDTPGRPPYFNASHGLAIETGRSEFKMTYRLEDQWLAWVPSRDFWNELACIGHVQLLKTMLASVGIFTRRAWVVPCTERMPDGSRLSLSDSDLVYVGTFPDRILGGGRKRPGTYWDRFKIPGIEGVEFDGSVGLIEPDGTWEAFEACAITPRQRFLPGGYETKDIAGHPNARDFVRNQGFLSAREVLRWWCETVRGRFRRFLCWVGTVGDPVFRETIGDEKGRCYWDRDGTFYSIKNFKEIREKRLDLPPP